MQGLYVRRFKKDVAREAAGEFSERDPRRHEVTASSAEDALFERLARVEFRSIDAKRESRGVLFRTLLTNTYADRVETYSGEGVQYLNERTEKEYAEVRTKVLSGKTEIPMDYRLLHKSNDWHVYDVVVDGVSLVNNYRGQFTKILHTSSYPELVDQLRKKSDKIKAP